ncbi:glycoside hydrolase family 2 TIM barrel-domain containing protein, partial [Candidatus Symbiothrix dinenymphae]|uniref:glycoside hydrolase family 2 TIM barrel-domain containing protein n=1 Tax=Candidatus Symbiothrix dinenymphae TaxID=467085 RepID=UPI000AB00F6E
RIIVWDLYNEPTNGGIGGKYTLPLVQKVFVWAREVAPSQPVTVAAWSGHAELNKIITDNSDVISFHLYSTKAETEKQIKHWKSFGRPVICTEWFHRLAGSTVADILPLFKEENVGSMLWGLVNGKSQAHLGWDHRPEMLPYTKTWKHDLYKGDFKPYDVSEIE